MASPQWMDRAACKGQQHLFILPERPRRNKIDGATMKRVNRAKAICRACPVIDECHRWVMAPKVDPAIGLVTAGLTDGERNQIRNRRIDARGTPRDQAVAL